MRVPTPNCAVERIVRCFRLNIYVCSQIDQHPRHALITQHTRLRQDSLSKSIPGIHVESEFAEQLNGVRVPLHSQEVQYRLPMEYANVLQFGVLAQQTLGLRRIQNSRVNKCLNEFLLRCSRR